MNRNVTNLIRCAMDEFLPPIVRDSRGFMYPFFHYWFKGKDIGTYMDFKSIAYGLTDGEFADVYRRLDCRATDRPTDLNDRCVKSVLSRLRPDARTVLDVGCGRGYFIDRVHDLGRYEAHGCDVLDDVPIRGHYHRGSIEDLPFEDGRFDIVTCHHTLEHIRRPDRAIAELKRVAKKQLIVVVPRQRYYYYTLDLHLNFFPTRASLEQLLKIADHECEDLGGDWVYTGNIDTRSRVDAPRPSAGIPARVGR